MITTTIEKAHELRADPELEETFSVMTELSLADAMRMGSRNSRQARGWGNGEEQCALHASVSGAIAAGFVEI